jgi:hypothetical protein
MFVRQDSKTKRWYQVSQRAMREKVGQAIRAALKRNHTNDDNRSFDDVHAQPNVISIYKKPPRLNPERIPLELYSEEQKLSSLSETSGRSQAISPTTFSRGLLQLREDPPTIEQHQNYGLYQAAGTPSTASMLNVSPPIHAAGTEMGNADETRRRLMEYAVANRMNSNPTSSTGSYQYQFQHHHHHQQQQQQQPNTVPFGFDSSGFSTTSSSGHGMVLGNEASFPSTDIIPHGIPLPVSDRFRTVATMDNTTMLPSHNVVQGRENIHGCTDSHGITDTLNVLPRDVLDLYPLEEDETQSGRT